MGKSIIGLAVFVLVAGCQEVLTHHDLPVTDDVLHSDHGDVRIHPPADITDMHAFVNGNNLVVALSTNPDVPLASVSYVFPTDVTFEIHIDNDSEVFDDPSDPTDVGFFGGTIRDPDNISEDVTFRIRFDASGSALVERMDHGQNKNNVKADVFYGLRDDPFIRTRNAGRNVGAIVIEVPLNAVLKQHAAILIWATTKLDEDAAPHELFGRPAGGPGTNRLHPRDHLRVAGVRPNVLIYDTARPASFPNGRALTDDVVDLVCLVDTDGDGVLEQLGNCNNYVNDLPPATENDVGFLNVFPYLAPPHPPF